MSIRSYDTLVAHVVWAVKGRARLLRSEDDAARDGLFRAKAQDAGGALIASGCAADHVHVLVRFPAQSPLSTLVGRLKGASARAHNLSRPTELIVWQDGFWANSCDPRDLREVTQYVLRQRPHHEGPTERELWEPIEQVMHTSDATRSPCD